MYKTGGESMPPPIMQQQNQQNVENGFRTENIPLNRMTSMEERAERTRMRNIFNMVSFYYYLPYKILLTMNRVRIHQTNSELSNLNGGGDSKAFDVNHG